MRSWRVLRPRIGRCIPRYKSAALMINLAVVVFVYTWLLWHGYQRRRGVWNAGSWLRFGALVAAGVALHVVALSMGFWVDRGVYAKLSPVGGQLYFATLMALMLIAPIATVALLLWFAGGHSVRWLGWDGSVRPDT